MRVSRATLRHWNKQRIAKRVAKWEAERVAILAAAAPDLLTSLREIVAAVEAGEVDGYSPSGDWFREAKSAIAKATGGNV